MNQTQMMNIFGLFLLTLGVALCAAFGARHSPVMYDFITQKGVEKAAKQKAVIAAPPSPMARVEGWASESGVPFGLGLLLITVGAVLARKAQRATMVPKQSTHTTTLTDASAFSAKLTISVLS